MRTEDEVRRRLDRAESAALSPQWRARIRRAEVQRDILRWVLGEADPS